MLQILGYNTYTEYQTALGRSDLCFEDEDRLYICEFKVIGKSDSGNVTNSVKMIHKERSKIDPPFYKTGGSFDNQGDFCGYFSFVSTRKIYKSNST